MRNSLEKTSTNLHHVLRRVRTWLERDGASRIIVARETTAELRRQKLPDHLQIISKKRHGKRHAMRKRRHYNEIQFKLAVWPQDKMDENALPSFACVISGEADFTIADYVLRCNAGDWVIFPAGVAKQDGSKSHFEGDSTGRVGDILWFTCWFGGVNCWICHSEGELHSKPPNSSCRVERRFLEKLFYGFCEEVTKKGDPQIIFQMLMLLLTMITKEVSQGDILWTIGSRFHYQEESRQHDPITAAQEFIEDNLDRHLTINAVARQVLVSPATFTKRFKEQTGKTFVEYQTERRLAIAEQMLIKTNVAISEICARIGIKYGRLRLLFQENHGCTPTAFRHNNRDNKNTVDINS